MKKIIILFGIFGLLFLIGCQTQVTGETKEFDLVANEFSFEPSQIEVNLGDLVKLNVKSVDVAHGFYLGAFDVNEAIAPGETKTIEFLADKVGTYSFACSVSCGSGHGRMQGVLVVK